MNENRFTNPIAPQLLRNKDDNIHKTKENMQGSKGIRQWPINLCTSPMMIQKINPSVDYNCLLKRLETQPNEPTNQNSIKVPKIFKPTNKRTLI